MVPLMSKREIRIVGSTDELSRAAARVLLRCAKEAVRARGRCALALSGGATPKKLYRLLADEGEQFRRELPWEKIQFFWSDERHVAPDDPESNYRMAAEMMLAHVSVPPENVHRVMAEDPEAERAAREYERTLGEVFHLSAGEVPRFDLILLGMGACGHTASLFPHSEALRERAHLVVATWVEKFKAHRITLTPPVLNNSSLVMFLVSGREKAETVRAVLEGPYEPDLYPAQVVRPTDGEALWLMDEEAARLLGQRDS